MALCRRDVWKSMYPRGLYQGKFYGMERQKGSSPCCTGGGISILYRVHLCFQNLDVMTSPRTQPQSIRADPCLCWWYCPLCSCINMGLQQTILSNPAKATTCTRAKADLWTELPTPWDRMEGASHSTLGGCVTSFILRSPFEGPPGETTGPIEETQRACTPVRAMMMAGSGIDRLPWASYWTQSFTIHCHLFSIKWGNNLYVAVKVWVAPSNLELQSDP